MSPYLPVPLYGTRNLRQNLEGSQISKKMCIIRGKNGYFVLYVVKNWQLCSLSCQKLAKYVIFVKVII